MIQPVKIRIPLGPWMADEGVFDNPGLVLARGLVPWSTNSYRPRSYLAFVPGSMPNTQGLCYGMYVHSFGSFWRAYYVADVAGAPKVWEVTLSAGTPPTLTGISALTDRTNVSWAATFALGYRFTSFGANTIAVGNDATDNPQMRDISGASAFADMIPATSDDRPRGRYVCAAGQRIAMAYITHSDAAEATRYNSSTTTNPNLVVFSGSDDPTYWSTPKTVSPLSGSNLWDKAKNSDFVQLLDDRGDITGLIMIDERYMLVFKEGAIYRLDAYTALPTEVLPLSREIGTRSPHSLVSAEGWVYFYDQLGHYSRVNSSGEYQDLTKGSIRSVLLSENWMDLGTYSPSDPDNPGAAWVAMPDIESIAGTPGAYRYPVGAFCPHSRCVSWVYPSPVTNRWMELMINIDTLAWSGTDVTHVHNKPSGERRFGIHWVCSNPGAGLRWAAPVIGKQFQQAPRDFLYAFESGSAPTTYSITYPWSDQDMGYLLLDDPAFRTPYFQIGEGGGLSVVTAFRLWYNRTRLAEAQSVDVMFRMAVLSKRYPSQTPEISYPNRAVNQAQIYDLNSVLPKDADGWYTHRGRAGSWHAAEITFQAEAFDVDFPSSAALVINELQAIELELKGVTG